MTLHLRFPARIVRDHADGGAAGVQLVEHVHQRFAALRIEVAGRLVGEQDRRTAGDRARDRDELLLAAGEVARMMFRARGEADAIERRVDARLVVPRRKRRARPAGIRRSRRRSCRRSG